MHVVAERDYDSHDCVCVCVCVCVCGCACVQGVRMLCDTDCLSVCVLPECTAAGFIMIGAFPCCCCYTPHTPIKHTDRQTHTHKDTLTHTHTHIHTHIHTHAPVLDHAEVF